MVDQRQIALFWDYLIFYPHEDENGFDGVHHGGIKGIKDDAPQAVKDAFMKYQDEQKRAKARGQKI